MTLGRMRAYATTHLSKGQAAGDDKHITETDTEFQNDDGMSMLSW